MRRVLIFCFVFLAFFSAAIPVFAQQEQAEKLRDNFAITLSDGKGTQRLSDGLQNTYLTLSENVSLHLDSDVPIASLYLEFDRIPAAWTLSAEGDAKDYPCGQNGFLHEYVDVVSLCGNAQNRLVLSFPSSASLAEVSAYSAGELPSEVQVWEPAQGEADLLLVSSHSDDDQLFFAGVLPTYTARSLEVQVAFFTNHWGRHDRPHETLDGLWHTGIRRYPVISEFPDEYSETLEAAESQLTAQGYDREAVLQWQTELLRRFRPLVVVGHDLQGEYGHGAHRYNASTLTQALSLANDPTFDPQSAEEFGFWSVERCYLHLYPENRIVCDFDIPLAAFGNKSAFEVSKEAFGFHKSQHWTWFADWIDEERAADITLYSPCEYGLYYSGDGICPTEGDFFSGLLTYAQRREAQEQALLEAQRQKEEAERLQKLEQAEKQLQALEEELQNKQAEANKLRLIFLCAGVLFVLILLAFLIFLSKRRRNESKTERVS